MTTTTTVPAVDVTLTAKDRGYRLPVDVTRAVYADAVTWDTTLKPNRRIVYATPQARLDDLLDHALFPAGLALASGEPVEFHVMRVPGSGRGWVPRRTRYAVHVIDGRVVIAMPGEVPA